MHCICPYIQVPNSQVSGCYVRTIIVVSKHFNVRVLQELPHKQFKYLHDSILITILGENLDALVGCQVASYKP
jgi:hypothetical protein